MTGGARATWGLLPVKCFDRGKSRLAPVLGDEERAAFARRLFDHTMGTLLESGALEGVLVATDCDDVAEAAHALHARVRMDAEPAALSSVVDAALADLASHGAGAAIVLMADLPRIEPGDVRAIARAIDDGDVVLITDVRRRHTNALALTLPARMATCFGAPESFRDHCAGARAAGLRPVLLENERVAFDVDGPEDHARLIAAPV